MFLQLEHGGEVLVSRKLMRFSGRALDATAGFMLIGEKLERDEQRQFDSQGKYGSGGWAPLAASTVQRKQAAGLDPRILVATGALRDSLTGKGDGAVREFMPSSMAFGTSVPYAKFHQQGTGRMPQRRPVEPPEGDRREYVRILQRFFVEAS